MSLSSWILALMVTALPPDAAAARTTHPEARETGAQRLERYEGIAAAIVTVVEDPATRLPYTGRTAHARTAALILAVSYFESGWRRDVDLGIGKLARGEGMDSCLLQLRVGTGTTAEGWDHAALTSDRTKCIRAGLAKLVRSISFCKRNNGDDKLAAYAAGSCESDAGRANSRKKFALMRRWLSASPPPASVTTIDPAPSALAATEVATPRLAWLRCDTRGSPRAHPTRARAG